MIEHHVIPWLQSFHPVIMALFATLFTWFVTAAGASLVFFTKRFNQKVMDIMLGIASGVMIAASYWSLLAPAIEMSDGDWKPAALGFLLGGVTLFGIDKILPHLHPGMQMNQAEGVPTAWRRSVLLVLAITLHNIPEGLAVGVGFGALGETPDFSNPESIKLIAGATALAFGIGIQNFPEGLAVAMPLRREGMGRVKAFLYGQASGMVEPVAGVLGAWFVLMMRPVLPYALAFAAGAMIFVVVEELVPESREEQNGDLASLGVLAGFTIMMSLDVALG